MDAPVCSMMVLGWRFLPVLEASPFMSDRPEQTRSSCIPTIKGLMWIASYPKSGNTWTRNFLHNLIGVCEGRSDEAQDINEMMRRSTWELFAPPYEEILGKPIKECSRAEIASVRPLVQSHVAENADGVAFVKTHHALVLDRGYSTINFDVTAGAIYIVRNPLDVAVSFSHHMNASVDEAIERMALDGLETAISERVIHEVYGSWRQHVESWTRKPHRTIYVMRYEDMLTDPEKTFGRLARHLHIKASPTQLKKAIELSSFENLQKQEDEHGFREKPERAERFFRSGTSGQWRDVLTMRQIRRVVRLNRVQMERFDYVPEKLRGLTTQTGSV